MPIESNKMRALGKQRGADQRLTSLTARTMVHNAIAGAGHELKLKPMGRDAVNFVIERVVLLGGPELSRTTALEHIRTSPAAQLAALRRKTRKKAGLSREPRRPRQRRKGSMPEPLRGWWKEAERGAWAALDAEARKGQK